MTDANRQILNLAKDGLSAAEIADCLGYDVDAVCIVLSQAPMSRQAVVNAVAPAEGSMEDLEHRFSRLQTRSMEVLEVLMNNSEDDNLKAKIAMYVTDQRLGLKKPQKAGTTFNIVNIENELRRAKAIANGSAFVDVEPRQLAVAS